MEHPAQHHRIVLIGCAGTGKSTLARTCGLPAIILDELWERPLQPADVPEFRERVKLAHKGDEWISDGNFAAASFDLRLPSATLVLWLEAPRAVRLYRTLVRALRGDTHRLQHWPTVVRYILWFDRVNRPRIEGLLAEHGAGVPVVHAGSLVVARGLVQRDPTTAL